MEALKNLCKGVIKIDIHKLLNEVLRQKPVKEYILKLNLYEQLYDKGIDSDGKVLGYYSPATELISGGRKKAGDHYTLLDTGYFYKSAKIKYGKDFIEIDADTFKTNQFGDDVDLIDKYGINILGLTAENLEKLNNFIIPLLSDKLKSKFDELLS